MSNLDHKVTEEDIKVRVVGCKQDASLFAGLVRRAPRLLPNTCIVVVEVSVALDLADAMNNLLVQAKYYIALSSVQQPMSGQQLCWLGCSSDAVCLHCLCRSCLARLAPSRSPTSTTTGSK